MMDKLAPHLPAQNVDTKDICTEEVMEERI
jgi:hypothetical protein